LHPMQVFYNTRLAEVWDSAIEQTKAEVLQARALQEDYVLGTLPVGALALTASVDVQANRLEMMVMAWGAGMERWIVDHQVI
ncbi:terminase gpA endonuclease subunit, partial [Pseudomonas shirazica]